MGETKGNKLSRRDFLKGAGIVAAGGFAAWLGLDRLGEAQDNPHLVGKDIPQEWIDQELPLANLDLINNPEYWVGENGEKLSKKFSATLYDKYEEVYPFFREFGISNPEVGDFGEWNSKKAQRAFDELMMNLADRGEDVVLARTKGFDNIQPDLNDRYYEMASYVQMITRLVAYKDEVGIESFVAEMSNLIASETISSINDTNIEQNVFPRKEIISLWNYDWPALGKDIPILSPVALSFVSPEGYELLSRSRKGIVDRYLSSDMRELFVNRETNKRPNKVEILNFDPEVETRMRRELQNLGLERSVSQITIESADFLSISTIRGPDTDRITFRDPQANTLNIDTYLAKEKEFLGFLIHEEFHGLSSRRAYLSTIDRMKMRELEQEILETADPLSDLQAIFNPVGDLHIYQRDNQHSITRYYLDSVLDVHGKMDLSAGEMLSEFNSIIYQLTGEDIISTMSVSEKDGNMNGLFDRLNKDYDNYQGVTKLIAKTLFANREAILSRKRMPRPEEYDSSYFSEVVMPLVFTHLSMHKPEEIAKSVLPEKQNKDRGLVANYASTFRKRMRSFVKSGPSEEFLAELFSASMLTRKFGKHDVEYVNEVKPKFVKIISLLRKNKLAVISNFT